MIWGDKAKVRSFRRYTNNEKKLAEAIAREEKRAARKARLRDWIGGAPDRVEPQA